MNIALGIEEKTQEDDIEKLIAAGADEFFCGIVPSEWANYYGHSISLNKRFSPTSQFNSFEQLKKIVDKIHYFKKKVFITFNAHYYTKEQLTFVEKYLRQTSTEIKPDAIIVTHPLVALLVRDLGLDLKMHIGGDAGVYNSRFVKFLKELGIVRIKFPRDMTINEMAKVIADTKHLGMEYEAFIMEQRCPFSGVGCRSEHGMSPSRDFCYHHWSKTLHKRLPFDFGARTSETLASGGDVSATLKKPSINELTVWNHNTSQYHMWTIGGLFPAFTIKDNKMRECGLCALSKLEEAGVNSLKVVTRGKTVKEKLFHLGVLSQALKNPSRTTESCKDIRGNREVCDIGYMCYYPEARKG
jgi:collagenase-like PrtC family protease